MLRDVVSASYKDGYQIELTFDNGESGVIDFSRTFSARVSSNGFATSASSVRFR